MNPTDKISTYFTYGEAIASATAARHGIDNTPDNPALARIILTARKMDSLRRFLGGPVIVTSWYRSPEVNRLIGSKPTSQHVQGEAVDFRCPQFGTPAQIVKAIRHLHFDQLILEYPDGPGGGWVHVSFTEQPRQQVLLIDAQGARALA